jgi:hypothetical protein
VTVDDEIKCGADGCYQVLAPGAVTEAFGWEIIDGGPWCPLHRAEKARTMLKFEEWKRLREQVAKLRAKRNAHAAKNVLGPHMYRKWDEFQSDLVNFHRNNGKLAPAALRTLDPKKFAGIYAVHGRIDVEAESVKLFEAEAKAAETRKWLLGRVE